MNYRNQPLVEAARYADAQAEEHGLENAIAGAGMDAETLHHVAQQRALRLVLLKHRGKEGMQAITKQNKEVPVCMSKEELADMTVLMLAYMDGLVIGWIGHSIQSRDGE